MTKVASAPDHLALQRLSFWTPPEDFFRLDASEWNSNGASVTVDTSLPGGILNIVSAATNNAAADIKRAYNGFLLSEDRPFQMSALVKFTEAGGAGDTNLFIGFTNIATGALQLANDGGGLPADWHGAGFFTVDGSQRLWCGTSVGTAQKRTDELVATNLNNLIREDVLASSAAYRLFKIIFRQLGPSDFEIDFWIDEKHVCTHRAQPASSVPVGEMVGFKVGAAAAETVSVDAIHSFGAR